MDAIAPLSLSAIWGQKLRVVADPRIILELIVTEILRFPVRSLENTVYAISIAQALHHPDYSDG